MSRCSETVEPLAGTAPQATWWWFIEAPGSWGSHPPGTSIQPDVASLASGHDRRVLLVRRTTERTSDRMRLWVVSGSGGIARGYVIDDPQALANWPGAGPDDRDPDPDAEIPRLLVCAHAARDICCGIDGRALLRRLGPRSGLWECSHLGGHRFAPTALAAVQGMVYGRLTDSVSDQLMCEEQPRPDLVGYMRGSPALDPQEQVAQLTVLTQRGEISTDLARVTDSPLTIRVSTSSGAIDDVVVGQHDVPARAVSCGGEPETGSCWVASLNASD